VRSQVRRCRGAIIGAVSLLLTGCAAAATPATTSAPTATPVVAVTAALATPSPIPTASAMPSPLPTQGPIVVFMNGSDTPMGPNLMFSPASITAKPGTINFSLNNQGDHFHGMSIAAELDGTPLASAVVPPHSVKAFVVEGLAPGAYKFWSPIGDDAKFGMVGTLTISP
jgi:uncharacterized cupredoxin-like copper-binding protein